MSEREALEQRIAEHPDDLDAWTVLGDLLQKQGDPHGEFVALQLAAARDPIAKKKTPAQLAAARYFAKHAEALLGPLVDRGADLKDPSSPPFIWRTGFIRRAELATGWAPKAKTLEALLDAPAGRMLDELTLRLAESDASTAFGTLLDRRPRLHQLEVWAQADLDATNLSSALPHLRHLSLGARSFELGELRVPTVRRAHFFSLAPTPENFEAIASAPWPVLERLEIRMGGRSLPARGNFEHLVPLLRRTDMPALTTLKLRGSSWAGAILRAVADGPLAGQLHVLDIQDGALNPEDIRYTVARKERFGPLRELWIPAHLRDPRVTQELSVLAKHVVNRPTGDVLWTELGAMDPKLLDRYRD